MPEITLREHLQKAAKARWAAISQERRTEHAKMMNEKRWANHKKDEIKMKK